MVQEKYFFRHLLRGLFSRQGQGRGFSENFGYVGVSPLIFTDTLKNNLLYGNKHEVDQEEIVKMVNLIQLFNESSEIDLNMQIYNKSLSSGQMQKISFIRALLSKVDILILDESMSNLDSKTKSLIYRVLNQLDLTIINSTHSIEDLDYDTHLSIKIEDDMRKVVKQLKKILIIHTNYQIKGEKT